MQPKWNDIYKEFLDEWGKLVSRLIISIPGRDYYLLETISELILGNDALDERNEFESPLSFYQRLPDEALDWLITTTADKMSENEFQHSSITTGFLKKLLMETNSRPYVATLSKKYKKLSEECQKHLRQRKKIIELKEREKLIKSYEECRWLLNKLDEIQKQIPIRD